jgi:DNA-binding MarR family transcriptional regulator
MPSARFTDRWRKRLTGELGTLKSASAPTVNMAAVAYLLAETSTYTTGRVPAYATSPGWIAQRLDISDSTAARALRGLLDAGWITRTQRANGKQSAAYRLTIPSPRSPHVESVTGDMLNQSGSPP